MSAIFSLPVSLPVRYGTLIAVLLFTVLVAELCLFIYKRSNRAPRRKCALCGMISLINSAALLCLLQGEPEGAFALAMQGLPWLFYAAMILFTALHLAFAFPAEKKRARSSLSQNSIREAIDDLPMGICFADPIGRIVLINNKMQTLLGELLGFCPQLLCEITEASSELESGTHLSADIVRMTDGSIYRFRSYEYTIDGKPGWKQITASEITRLYAVGEQLRAENEKLRRINDKLKRMYERMSDDIREKESLEMKIYIHDSIGRSILTLRDIMQNGDETEEKVAALREAVSVLSSRRPALAEAMDEVKQSAAKIGITINIKGHIPPDTLIEKLAASAARECVTNCIKHAKGDKITITADDLGAVYRIAITNNGDKPKGKIREGSGLSSLRRSVEFSGGEMTLSHYPAFCLMLNIPREEEEE